MIITREIFISMKKNIHNAYNQ